MNIYNFKINYNKYFNVYYISCIILPIKKKYCITKIFKIKDKKNLIKILSHIKKNKKIKLHKNKIATWHDQ